MRTTRRISWMVSGWIEQVRLGEGEGGTAALTLGCSDDFYAVRLGFANVSHESWRLTKVIGAASAGYGDYVHPVEQAQWIPFTFAMNGADDDRIVSRADAPTTIEVAPAKTDPASGHDDEPRWTWTDWTPLKSAEPDPETGMRVLMLRGLVPSNQTISHAVGQLRSLLGDRALSGGFETFIGGIKFDRDCVNDPDGGAGETTTATWIDNQLAAGSLFPIVQFLTRNEGVVGMTAGDSHQQGTSTTEQFTGFLYRAATALGAKTIGARPAGMVNCAAGGLASDRFFARLAALLPAVRPSYVVLPGWTFNDTTSGAATGEVHADEPAMRVFAARLLAAIELCKAHGAIPICLTPFPRDAENMAETQLAPWRALRSMIVEHVGRDAHVLDASAIFGARDGAVLTGLYQDAMTDEYRHPNDAGHAVLAEHLQLLVAGLAAGRLFDRGQ